MLETTPPERDKLSLSISISGIINWFKDRRIKKDLNNIKSYDDFITENQNRRDETNG